MNVHQSWLLLALHGLGAALPAQSNLRRAPSCIDELKGYVSVREFGARGDGVSDDTAAVQAAADAIGGTASAGNRVLIINPGVYLVRSIRLKPDTAVMGAGATLKGHPAGTGEILRLADDCTVRGLAVDGNKPFRPASIGILLQSSYRCLVEDCRVSNIGRLPGSFPNFGAGIFVSGPLPYIGSPNTACDIRNCHVRDCDTNGVSVVFVWGTTVTGCRISQCRFGIGWWGTPTRPCGHLRFEGNYIAAASLGSPNELMQAGIWGTHGTGIKIVNNEVLNCRDVGIDPESSTNVIITNNRVSNCVNAGIASFNGSSEFVIANNHVVQLAGPARNGAGIKFFGGSTFALDINHSITGNVIRVSDGCCIEAGTGRMRHSIIDSNRLMHDPAGSALCLPGAVNVRIGDNL